MTPPRGAITLGRVTRHLPSITESEKTEPHVFVVLDIDTPNGALRVTVDAGLFSRACAYPGRPVSAELERLDSRGAA